MSPLTEIAMRPLRFLLAEHSTFSGAMPVAILERRGHRVTIVENGRKAIVELVRDDFDCVLLDIVTVDDGLAVLDAIRSSVTEQVDASIPVIGLVRDMPDSERGRCLNAGVDALLVRPVRVVSLLKTVHDVLERKGLTVLEEDAYPARIVEPRLRSKKGIEKDFGLSSSDVDELYEMLLASIHKEFSALKVATVQGWSEELAEMAHSLAGSALDIVSVGPTLLAREIEYVARYDEPSQALPLCEELESQLDIVLGQMTRTLAISQVYAS